MSLSVRKKRGRHTHLISFADPSPTQPQPDAVLLADRLRDSGLKEATEKVKNLARPTIQYLAVGGDCRERDWGGDGGGGGGDREIPG